MQFLNAAAAWLIKGFGLSIASDSSVPESVETPVAVPLLRQKPVLRLIVNPLPLEHDSIVAKTERPALRA